MFKPEKTYLCLVYSLGQVQCGVSFLGASLIYRTTHALFASWGFTLMFGLRWFWVFSIIPAPRGGLWRGSLGMANLPIARECCLRDYDYLNVLDATPVTDCVLHIWIVTELYLLYEQELTMDDPLPTTHRKLAYCRALLTLLMSINPVNTKLVQIAVNECNT